jgi:Na+/H+ antiporter NhaD/arsenite permease-like protein
LLMAVVVIGAPICAILPNATVVILVAPIIIRLCRRLGVDFVQPVILLVFVANSAGLLTLAGDRATFIVGSSIRLSFADYLVLLSPAGVLAIAAVVAMSPVIFRSVWRARLEPDMPPTPTRIEHPWVMLAYLAVMIVMIVLFVFGEGLIISVARRTRGEGTRADIRPDPRGPRGEESARREARQSGR